jgi:hypothetical protein
VFHHAVARKIVSVVLRLKSVLDYFLSTELPKILSPR